ncbi:MAG TPA: hypothetical protein VHM90_14975 [Phycisphaerae bacterium]|nr:hypothetical protein [Phycisphaerae bacterium]
MSKFLPSSTPDHPRDGSKKRRILDRLEQAVAAGEVKTARAWALELQVCERYIFELVYDSRQFRRVIHRYKFAQHEAVTLKVEGTRGKTSLVASPYLRLPAAIVRMGGFGIGEEVLVRAERGKIVVMRRAG